MLPDFLIIGAPKCATTWLADCLREHPQLFIPAAKELKYFCGRQLAQGREWYEAQFRGARPGQLLGEASPSYLGSPEAPGRIAALLPEARLIVSLRHPVEQAYSFYWHLKSRGLLSPELPFRRFFEEQRPQAGRYGEHLARYLERFPPERLLVLVYETEIAQEPLRGLRRCHRFLGVGADHTPAALGERRNGGRDLRPLPGPAQAVRRGLNLLPGGLRRSAKGAAKALLGLLPARQRREPLSRALRDELMERHCLADLQRLKALADVDLSVWSGR